MPENPENVSQTPMDLVEKYREDILSAPGAEITPPKEYNIPKEYDLSLIPQDDRGMIEDAIKEFEYYLHLPIITDDFKSHNDERRPWRQTKYKEILESKGETAAKEFNEALGKNKLKRNVVGRLYSYSFLIQDHVPPELTEPIINLTQEHVMEHGKDDDPWARTSNEQKIEIVNKIADSAEQILQHFAKS
jgi:hypothetical protein